MSSKQMKPERWRRIEALYHATLSREQKCDVEASLPYPTKFAISLLASGQHFLFCSRIPQLHCAISASRGQPLAVG